MLDATDRWLRGLRPVPNPRKPTEAIPRDVRVIGQVDYFRVTDAPYVREERQSASGRSYSVKVYTRDAYTAAHMMKSSESGRLVRWGVRLDGDRVVSREGLLRVRAPEALERLRARGASLRGAARDEALAEALWQALSPDEREAMVAEVDLEEFADGRGEREALRALLEHLRAEGSLLASADVDWHRRVRDRYAARWLGGPVGSSAWASAPWARWLAYWYERAGERPPAEAGPESIAAFVVARGAHGREARLAPWWGALMEYVANASGDRVAEADGVLAALARRLGGQVDPAEIADFPPDVPSRLRFHEALDARLARLDPAWLREVGPGAARPLVQPMLRAFHYATLARGARV